ncbi:hypothetical protein DQ04_02371080 [Trypanosoma grayi]|uniref:hypothetical protein n=1 Tax=Trypanosoma grayi TaxID=71804 RepID=UPI0004F49748|nr:hypothetical protein DQ04_02371080 [Trypanosoma grayi]KEG11685.1 hypothetical protein DQ04_02371080 [Trypanosoma grayi]
MVVALLGVVVYVTVSYCFYVYYDRESAFRDALACSIEVLREKNVAYWLQNGTLLGSTRLGRLVLWDADLDIGYNTTDNSETFAAMLRDLDSRCFGVSSSTRSGVRNPMNIHRKCTNRICAEFHETIIKNGFATSGDGVSPEKELVPLKACTIADVVAQCPHNPPYYLKEAYGSEWLTRSLAEFF